MPTPSQFSRDATTLGGSTTGGSRLRSIIFILIESGAALFCIQLVRLTVSILKTNIALLGFDLIVGIHQMLNVNIKIPKSVLTTFFFL